MKALIIVDIQNDFVSGGALAVPQGEEIIPTVNQLQKEFDLIVATQDWHPESHESFAVSHKDKNVGETIDLHGLPQILWPVHCVQHTFGSEFVKELDQEKWQKVFVKGTDTEIDSYSGFFDNGYQKSTGMSDFLKKQEVTDVYVVGLAADYCVKFTALDALKEGFNTYLITDATRGVNIEPDDTQQAFDDMEKAGVILLNSKTILQK